MDHANLQMEVAALELRRSGTVVLEANLEAGWKPDVLLAHESSPIGVECVRLGPAGDVISHLATPGAPERVVDGWRRVGAMVIRKAGGPPRRAAGSDASSMTACLQPIPGSRRHWQLCLFLRKPRLWQKVSARQC